MNSNEMAVLTIKSLINRLHKDQPNFNKTPDCFRRYLKFRNINSH